MAHFILQNTGVVSKRFLISPLGRKSAFSFDFESPDHRPTMLAPGITVKFVVKYLCVVAKNYFDNIIISVEDSPDVIVNLRAVRGNPTLKVLPPMPALLNDRYAVLSHTIECGVVLPGNTIVLNLTFHNLGSTAKFIMISEDDWASQEITSITSDNKLQLPLFTVYPAYFHIEKKGKITLNVVFSPQEFGLFTERVYIMCDNSTMAFIDLLGEGSIIEYSFIRFHDMEKVFSAAIDDDPSTHLFYSLTSMCCNGMEKNVFSVFNESYLNLNYHWELSECVIPFSEHNQIKKLRSSCINVSPSKGCLHMISETECTVTVIFKNMLPGSYRTNLSLFVENLDEGKVPFHVKEKLIPDPKHKGMKLELAKIELWVECKRAEIMIEPYIVEFNGEQILCNSPDLPQTDILVRNLSVAPVDCLWKIPTTNFASIVIQPSEFSIPVYGTVVCKITINSSLPHRFNKLIRCIVNKGECISGVIVKITLTQGRLLCSTQLKDFGTIQKYSPTECSVIFTNISHNQPFWRCNEFIFTEDEIPNREELPKHGNSHWVMENMMSDFKLNTGSLKHHKLSFSKEGRLNMINEEGVIVYKLYSDVEQIWCSLLLLDLGDTREYVAIIADIQDPLISLTHCWLPILDDMILRQPLVVSLKLRNHSGLSIPFAWSHPIGHQQHDFLIRVRPKQGILLPRKHIEIYFKLFPVKAGVKTCILMPCFFQNIKDPLLVLITGLVKPLTVYLQWYSRNKLCSATWPKFNINNVLVDWDTFKYANNLQYVEALSPFHYFKLKVDMRDKCDSSFCLLPESNVTERKVLQDASGKDGHKYSVTLEDCTDKQNKHNNNYSEGEEKENASKGSIDDSLYDLYQNYPLVSGKYVINRIDVETKNCDSVSAIQEEGTENNGDNAILTEDNNIYFELNKNLNFSAISQTEVKSHSRRISRVPIRTDGTSVCSHSYSYSMQDHLSRKSIIQKIVDYDFRIVDYTEVSEKQKYNICDSGLGTLIFSLGCWKVSKQVITMTGYVPERTLLSVTVNNYKECNPVKEFSIAVLMGKQKDEWRDRIPEGQGLIIVPEPKVYEMTGHDNIAINVWVYANTWGTYTDTLSVAVGYLPPLHLHILVQVCDNPIVLPSLFEPIIRMGCLSHNSDNRSYTLRVRNNCSVDVIVKWYVYLTDYYKKFKPKENDFGLMLVDTDNINPLNPAGVLKLILTPYYGKFDFNIYNLNKSNLFLKAWSEDLLEITLNAKAVEYQNVSLNAHLVGRVYKSPKLDSTHLSSSESDIVLCESYSDILLSDFELIEPVVINIIASMEVSRLSLISASKYDFIFKVCAIDVVNCNDEKYIVKRSVKFRNSGQCSIIFSITVHSPYSIVAIEKFDIKYIHNVPTEIDLKPGEMCVFTVQLGITKTFIQEIIQKNPLPTPKNRDEAKKPPFLNREHKEIKDMCISQQGAHVQYREMEMRLIFPTLEISCSKVMFGPVYINSTKFEQIYLNTADTEPVYFEFDIFDSNNNNNSKTNTSEFEFVPKCGYIQPKIPYEVRIYFTPVKAMDYKEKYVLKTAVPNHNLSFYAIGVGTLNYKDVHQENHL